MTRDPDNLSGVLVIDKGPGFTSHDVVAIVKRLARARKVGHLGTLDPAASGVLPLVINEATMHASKLAGGEKVYEFTLSLGRSTDTDDDTGRTIAEAPVPAEIMSGLVGLLPRFVGWTMQVPPAYSAVKRAGVRSYRMAREGRALPLDPRPAEIRSLELVGGCMPEPRLRMACGPGTFVRALCRDLGAALGCGGHAKGIRRLASGPYIIDMAVTLEALKAEPNALRDHIVPVAL